MESGSGSGSRPPGIIRRPTTGTVQSQSGVSRRTTGGTPMGSRQGSRQGSRTLIGQSVHWPSPSMEAQYVDGGTRMSPSAPTSARTSETSIRTDFSRRSTAASMSSTGARWRGGMDRRMTEDSMLRTRGSVYMRPSGLRNPHIHLLFVVFRVALAIIADMFVQYGAIPIAMPRGLLIEVEKLRADWLIFAAIINSLFGHMTIFYQILTSRGLSVFVFWIILRVVWMQMCPSFIASFSPRDFGFQMVYLVIGSYCLSVSLFHSDNVWAENDLDLVDYNDAVARMNLARGF